MKSKQLHRKKLRFWLVTAAIVLLLVVGIRFYVHRTARQQIERELTALNLGRVTLGAVGVSTAGVKATDVRIFRDKSDGEPWITLGELVIVKPIRALIAGQDDYDRIEIRGAQMQLDLDGEGSRFSFNTAMDLSQVQLPTDHVLLRDATIVVRQTDHHDLVFENLNADLKNQTVDGEDIIDVAGQIVSFWHSDWQLQGTIQPRRNQAELQLRSPLFTLPTYWTQFPTLPTNLNASVDLTGNASIEAKLTRDENGQLDYLATLVPKSITVQLPAFDLAFELLEGQVVLQDEIVDFQHILATSDGQDRVRADGKLAIGQFPLDLRFDAIAEQVSVSTLRKLVPAIPPQVHGLANGTGNGRVQITSALDTELQLTAEAKSIEAGYGTIEAASSTTFVNIESLVLDPQSNVRHLAGDVSVEATASNQPIQEVMNTFELQALQRQLDLDLAGNGQVHLKIPLATADRLETWDLTIVADADQGSISQRPLADIHVQSRLVRGNLRFDDITAIVNAPTGDSQSSPSGRVSVDVDWPIAKNAQHPKTGDVTVKGESLPAPWLIDLIAAQLENLDAASQIAQAERRSIPPDFSQGTRGSINTTATIQIDVALANDPSGWIVKADFHDSTLGTRQEKARSISARTELRNGILTIHQMSGQIGTDGSLTGSATIDVVKREAVAAAIRSDDLPFAWFLELAGKYNPDIYKWIGNVGWVIDGDAKNIDGRISVRGNLRGPEDERGGQLIEFSSNSKRLKLKGEIFDDLQVHGNIQAGKIEITEASVQSQSGGSLRGQGSWSIKTNHGSGAIQWSDLRLRTIAELSSSAQVPFAGSTSGQLSLRSTGQESSPMQDVSGSVSVNKFRFLDRWQSNFQLDVQTRDSVVHVTRVTPEKKLGQIDLRGNVSLQSPYNFDVQAEINRLQLSKLAQPDAKTSKTPPAEARLQRKLSGLANGTVHFAGTLSPFDWSSQGTARIREPAVAGQLLSGVSAEWSHDDSDWSRTKATLNILGGKLELVEAISKPNHIQVAIANVKATELSALAGPDFPPLEGLLQGTASLNRWDVRKESWADLILKGASTVVTHVNVTDLGGEVDYRNQKLTYSIKGRLLGGSVTGQGSTDMPAQGLRQASIPLQVKVDGARLNRMALESNRYRDLAPLAGDLSAQLQMNFSLTDSFAGTGRLRLNELSWRNQRITRLVTTDVRIANGVAELDHVRANLPKGEISGRARIPFANQQTGTYLLDIRQFDFARSLEILLENPVAAKGLFDAHISGQIGKYVTGRGSMGFQRANLFGIVSDSLRVPVQFQYDPINQSGSVEVRQSAFRLVDGRVTGEAAIDFGNTTNVDIDLNLNKLDTGKLFSALNSMAAQGQGELSGQLVLRGRGIRSERDLKGSFTGTLDRADAFRLPLLNEIGIFLGASQLRGKDFQSDKIDLVLSNGRVEVRNLSLHSSLAQIAIHGVVYLDGRLDLSVAARIERINQPTLLEEIAGSPLALYTGNPAALLVQAAEFLNDRVAFLKVSGTLARPQIRLDAGQQIREETIRYFLRGSQILPIANRRNE